MMPARIFHSADWERSGPWNGGWNGEMGGTDVSFIFTDVREAGKGPRLHSHTYDEVQIVRRGRAVFTVDGKEIEAGEGDIVVIPAGTSHKVRSAGGRTDVISVHLSGKMAADWLE